MLQNEVDRTPIFFGSVLLIDVEDVPKLKALMAQIPSLKIVFQKKSIGHLYISAEAPKPVEGV